MPGINCSLNSANLSALLPAILSTKCSFIIIAVALLLYDQLNFLDFIGDIVKTFSCKFYIILLHFYEKSMYDFCNVLFTFLHF